MGRSYETKCRGAEIIMAWNKPAFSNFYSTDEQHTFPNLGTLFIHLITLFHVSEESKLGSESDGDLRVLHDTLLSLQKFLLSYFQT